MAKRKKNSVSAPPLRRMVEAAGQVPPTAILGLLLVVIVVGLLVYGWQTWGRIALARADTFVSEEQLEVTPQPDWIERRVTSQVFRSGSLGNLSLLDRELTYKVLNAFEMNPWVADVSRVGKRSGGKIVVELEYRKPVAWVEIPDGMTDRPGPHVLPIDREAVVLPTSDLEHRLDSLPLIRILIRNPQPWGLEGQAWGDPRIAGAAKIAALLEDNWRELGLIRIRMAEQSDVATYELQDRKGMTYLWGSPPGSEGPDELSARQKLSRLRAEAERAQAFHGGRVDLRTATPPVRSWR